MTTKPYYSDDLVTLYHGDCTDPELVPMWAHVDGTLVTDPPYGISYLSGRVKRPGILGIRGDDATVTRDLALAYWHPKPALVFGSWKAPRPQRVRQMIVWDKRGGAGFSGDLAMPWADITEEIYVLGTGWLGPRVPAIYSIPTLPSNKRPDHPTPKPVKLMQALLEHCPAGTIVDPFAGSGATLIAARELGRQSIGVEVDERYAELTAKRLAQQSFDLGSIA